MAILTNSIEVKKGIFSINGEYYEYKDPLNVKDLLSYLGFNTKIIVIDYNGNVLQRESWTKTFIKSMDKIEILTIAGGG